MNDMKVKADEMLQRFLLIDKAFIWEQPLMKHFAALLLTQNNLPFNEEQFKSALEQIKAQTGTFSYFRGLYKFSIASLLIADQSYSENSVRQVIENEERLKSVGFKQGQHMPIACYTLYKVSQEADPHYVAKRAYELYMEMKKNHPFLTSSDDYSLSLLLAHLNPDMSRIEMAYERLNQNGFAKSNVLQTLSHILAISDLSIESLVEKCILLKQVLKENKLASGTTYYPAIGVMALLLDVEPTIGNQWVDLSGYLNKLKKYKWLGKPVNVILSASLLSNHFITEVISNEVMRVTLNTSIEAIIAAQTAAIIAITAASSAAATASTSS